MQTVIVIVWITLNIVRRGLAAGTRTRSSCSTWPSPPQAAYAAPLILLAQNRQDDRDRVNLEEDRTRRRATKADTEYLARELAALRIAIGEVATRDFLRGELDKLCDRLSDVVSRGGSPAADQPTADALQRGEVVGVEPAGEVPHDAGEVGGRGLAQPGQPRPR